MKKPLMEMPLSERLAPQILTQEGFRQIRWESLVDWQCHYDFSAIKNGHKYLIEVKPNFRSIDLEKLQHLKRFGMPILFLIVNPVMKEYTLLPLEALETEIGKVSSNYRFFLNSDGRLTLPIELRKKLQLTEGSVLEGEAYGDDKLLITVLRR